MSSLWEAVKDKEEHPKHEWRDKDGAILMIGRLRVYALGTSGGDICPASTGWTLVEEHKPCAHCGGQAIEYNDEWIRCASCGVGVFTWVVWDRRVSGWHRPDERPPEEGAYPIINHGGREDRLYWRPKEGWGQKILAWHDRLDVPPPVTP